MNNLTLDKLLTKLTEDVQIPEQDEEILKAVSVVGKNIGIGGEPVWCLNKDVTIDKDGCLTKAEDHGLIWISHLTDIGNGKEIADESLSARVEKGEITNAYFDAMSHFLGGSLEENAKTNPQLNSVVSELFGHDPSLAFESEWDGEEEPNSPEIGCPGKQMESDGDHQITNKFNKENFLSQFFLASTGVIMANYQEVRSNCKTHLNI